MSKYHSLFPELEKQITTFTNETNYDTESLIALPYPYLASGRGGGKSLFYFDTFFINLGLLKLNKIDLARHNVENLVFLARKNGFIPASNEKSMQSILHLPFLPWIVRDVYRATGDKGWLNKMLPAILDEFKMWTTKPHTTPTGLYRYVSKADAKKIQEDIDTCWINIHDFTEITHFNPVNLNALLCRNAKLIYDLQVEVDGQGDETLLTKSDQILHLLDICWDNDNNFFYDNDFVKKQLTDVKMLSAFFPLFVEIVAPERAQKMYSHLPHFLGNGGIACSEKDIKVDTLKWRYPLSIAPYVYTIIKGLCDYEFMEDAADIGASWLDMVISNYEKTGQFWEWYNVENGGTDLPSGPENRPIWGWTAGTFIALIDTLGLD
ncbi:hypothetical protein JW935_24750 [candidate division KSB1 bacterium]|nr:hypothetical protein [candidate division KSB1 bacterium]